MRRFFFSGILLLAFWGGEVYSAKTADHPGTFDYRHPRPSGAIEPGAYSEKEVDFSTVQERASFRFDTTVQFPGSEVPPCEIEGVEVNGKPAGSFLIENNGIINLNRRTHGGEDLSILLASGWQAGQEYQFQVKGKTPSGKPVLLAAAQSAPPATTPTMGLTYGTPTVEFPYHYAQVVIPAGMIQPGTATRVEVDGKRTRNARFFTGEEPRIPLGESYTGVVQGKGDLKVVAPCDWVNSSSHTVAITLKPLSGEEKVLRASGTAPGSGGYWNSAWPHSISITLRETAGILRQGEPVHLSLGLFADTVTNPANEIRVVTTDPQSPKAGKDGYVVAPCQVTQVTTWNDQKILSIEEKDKETGERVHRYDPTTTVDLVFLADMQPYQEKVYQVLYGNPKAEAVPLKTDLVVTPTKGIGEIVETASYRIGLATNSGAMESVTILGKGEPVLLEHKLETNGAVHWNPDCYSPPTPWVHVSDWENPERRVISGPLMHRTRSYGPLPHMTNVSAHVAYTFYSGQPYVLCSSSMQMQEDLFVQASRNAELVFNHAVLDEFIWIDPSGAIKNLEIETTRKHPIHGLEIPPDTPWMAFINREKKVGFASLLLQYANSNLFGDPASLAQPYIYVQNGPWIYWSRGLVYPFGGLNFTRMMPVRAGSVYLETTAWVPFRFEETGDPFAGIQKLHERLTHPLLVHEWMRTDERTPEKWVMPILTMPFDEGVSGAVSGHKAPKE